MAHRMRGTHQRHQTPAGLTRSRYAGDDGIKRWVGLGVIADNLISIARASRKKSAG